MGGDSRAFTPRTSSFSGATEERRDCSDNAGVRMKTLRRPVGDTLAECHAAGNEGQGAGCLKSRPPLARCAEDGPVSISPPAR